MESAQEGGRERTQGGGRATPVLHRRASRRRERVRPIPDAHQRQLPSRCSSSTAPDRLCSRRWPSRWTVSRRSRPHVRAGTERCATDVLELSSLAIQPRRTSLPTTYASPLSPSVPMNCADNLDQTRTRPTTLHHRFDPHSHRTAFLSCQTTLHTIDHHRDNGIKQEGEMERF